MPTPPYPAWSRRSRTPFRRATSPETEADLLEFPTPDETIAALRNGEVDAVLADKAFLAPYVDDSNGELVFLGDVILGEGIGIGTRQSDDDCAPRSTA